MQQVMSSYMLTITVAENLIFASFFTTRVIRQSWFPGGTRQATVREPDEDCHEEPPILIIFPFFSCIYAALRDHSQMTSTVFLTILNPPVDVNFPVHTHPEMCKITSKTSNWLSFLVQKSWRQLLTYPSPLSLLSTSGYPLPLSVDVICEWSLIPGMNQFRITIIILHCTQCIKNKLYERK